MKAYGWRGSSRPQRQFTYAAIMMAGSALISVSFVYLDGPSGSGAVVNGAIWGGFAVLLLHQRKRAPAQVSPPVSFWRTSPMIRVLAGLWAGLPYLVVGLLPEGLFQGVVGAFLWAPVLAVIVSPLSPRRRARGVTNRYPEVESVSDFVRGVRERGHTELEEMRAYEEQRRQAEADKPEL